MLSWQRGKPAGNGKRRRVQPEVAVKLSEAQLARLATARKEQLEGEGA